MTYVQYQYVFRHEVYGILDKTIYDEDLHLSVGDYVNINDRVEINYFKIEKICKILDHEKNMIIYILYIGDSGNWLDDEIE